MTPESKFCRLYPNTAEAACFCWTECCPFQKCKFSREDKKAIPGPSVQSSSSNLSTSFWSPFTPSIPLSHLNNNFLYPNCESISQMCYLLSHLQWDVRKERRLEERKCCLHFTGGKVENQESHGLGSFCFVFWDTIQAVPGCDFEVPLFLHFSSIFSLSLAKVRQTSELTWNPGTGAEQRQIPESIAQQSRGLKESPKTTAICL